MLKKLKEAVLKANLELVENGLVLYTWGNVSGIDREKGVIVIKPSGVSYADMKADDMVVVDLATGAVREGDLRPSSDTPTHLALYRAWPNVAGVVHTHSTYATAWAQAGRDIPNIGTTHADYFHHDIPCTPDMTEDEVRGDYELETGNVIVRTFAEGFRSERKFGTNPTNGSIGVGAEGAAQNNPISPDETPGVLVKNHGPFAWGTSPANAVYNATVLEQVAKMAFVAGCVNPQLTMNPLLIEKHYARKHGPNAYYGQKK